MFPASTIVICLFVLKCVFATFPTALIGKTPCCIDKLSSSTCVRLRTANQINFDKRCANDADFALVQCCSTWCVVSIIYSIFKCSNKFHSPVGTVVPQKFQMTIHDNGSLQDQVSNATNSLDSSFPRRGSNSSMRYADTVLRQVQSPLRSSCWDRRGAIWCDKLVQKTGFWETPRFAQVGCETFPFAFRECRHSCGYCSAGNLITRLNYDYNLASDPRHCDAKTYFARSEEEVRNARIKKNQDFDPLALLKLVNKRPDDYFVVTDHNYDVEDSKERSAENFRQTL